MARTVSTCAPYDTHHLTSKITKKLPVLLRSHAAAPVQSQQQVNQLHGHLQGRCQRPKRHQQLVHFSHLQTWCEESRPSSAWWPTWRPPTTSSVQPSLLEVATNKLPLPWRSATSRTSATCYLATDAAGRSTMTPRPPLLRNRRPHGSGCNDGACGTRQNF